MWDREGTTIFCLYIFIQRLIDDLQRNHLDSIFCFKMDDLNEHQNTLVIGIIIEAGHRFVFRAPYWAVDRAIEYVLLQFMYIF